MSISDNFVQGTIVMDARQEFYLRVDDPDRPWRFLNSLVAGGEAEPRDAGFPHEPTVIVAILDKTIYATTTREWPSPRRSGGPQYTP